MTVQMPSGIPVATVGIDGAKNAALLAVAMLSVTDLEMKTKLDEFRHEQYLSIREAGSGKHVVISGCSHKGILNIMGWLEPDALIGGFHFMGLDTQGEGKAELDHAAEALAQHDCTYFTCHCTGKKQFDYLKEKLGERLHYFAGGMSVEL